MSGGPVGTNTSILSEVVRIVKDNSEIVKDNSEIMKRTLGVLIQIEKRENRKPKLPSKAVELQSPPIFYH